MSEMIPVYETFKYPNLKSWSDKMTDKQLEDDMKQYHKTGKMPKSSEWQIRKILPEWT